MAADPSRIYIEAGPGRTLSSLAKAQGSIPANAVINSLPHADEDLDDRLHFFTAVGRAWATGLELPIERVWSGAKSGRVRLPTYPFQHQRYFLDRVVSAHNEPANEQPVKRPDMAAWGWAPAWKPAYAERSAWGRAGAGRVPCLSRRRPNGLPRLSTVCGLAGTGSVRLLLAMRSRRRPTSGSRCAPSMAATAMTNWSGISPAMVACPSASSICGY